MKRHIIAAILSGILPGAGQFYNRQWLKGIGFLVPVMILSAFVRRRMSMSEPSVMILLVLIVILVLAVWSVVDAYRSDKPTS